MICVLIESINKRFSLLALPVDSGCSMRLYSNQDETSTFVTLTLRILESINEPFVALGRFSPICSILCISIQINTKSQLFGISLAHRLIAISR
jgi:hypothetical protein